MNLASPEAGQHRTHHIQRLEGRTYVGPLRQGVGRLVKRLAESDRWRRRSGERGADVHRDADQITGGAPMIVVAVVNVENGLQTVAPRGGLGERLRKDDIVHVDVDRFPWSQMDDLFRCNIHAGWRHHGYVDGVRVFRVNTRGRQEDQHASRYWLREGFVERDPNPLVSGRWGLRGYSCCGTNKRE